MTEDKSIRICRTVKSAPFMVLEVSGAVSDVCSQCSTPIWVDTQQVLPAGIPHLTELWCTPCAAKDPDIGPTLPKQLLIAAQGAVLGLPPHAWLVSDEHDGKG